MTSYYMENLRNSANNINNIPGTRNDPVTPSATEQPYQEQSRAKERKGVKLIVHRFFHYTTINGLQRLSSASTIIGRMFWIIVVLAALAMFSRDFYYLIVQYYGRPISIVSKLDYYKKMPFPAVTICNVNPIRNGSIEIAELTEGIKKRNDDICFKEGLRNSSCDEDVDVFETFEDEIDYILSTTNETILRKAGHQRGDFIVGCRFNGKRCRKKEYWTQFWNPEYGNCFVLNGKLKGYNRTIPSFSATKAGNSNGLQLVLNIEIDQYIPEITEDAGVKLVIGVPDEMPFPLYRSISLAPGFRTDVSLKRISIKRVDRFNNGSCQAKRELDKDNPYYKKYNVSYNVQACLHNCYARSQLKQCGCAEYSLFTATPTGEVCNESEEKIEKCLKNWSLNSGSCDQTCKQPCEETVYEPSISFTRWPSPVSVEGVLDSLGKNYSDYDRDIANVWNNYLSVNIFYQRFIETHVEESLTYATTNLLADIGGQIGLWAGLSVISMCELIELVALLLRYLFHDRANRTNE